MQIKLEYGRSGLSAEIPDANLVKVLNLSPAEPVADPNAAIEHAIRNPIGARSLTELAQGKRDACIVICDVTRPVPNKTLLPPILAALTEAGIPREKVTILIATGTHRPNEGAELEGMIGREIAETCRIVNHVCTDKEAMQYLGTTDRGTPVNLNRAYCTADLRLTVGLIEPHFMAGYSGGRKLIMPGIAAMETVQAWHSPKFLEHPNATNGIVKDNPVHEESLTIARMRPPDMIVDVTLNQQNEITGIFAGDLWEAWRAGVAFAEKHVRVPLPEQVDIIITTCAGAPLDATFYQAIKGMVGALPVVKPGGSVIIAASCSEGVGSVGFSKALTDIEDMGVFIDAIQQPDWAFIPEQWQIEEFGRVVLRNDVYLVCDGIPRERHPDLFVQAASSVEDAVAKSLTKYGPDATIAVIPKGPYVIPYVSVSMA